MLNTRAHFDDPTSARGLAEQILSTRSRPLVMVSTVAETGAPGFDVDALRAELSGIADVVTVTTGPFTRALEGWLPNQVGAYGGAARCYPPDFGAEPTHHRAQLRFPSHSSVDTLVADALGQQQQSGQSTASRPPSPTRVQGRVTGLIADGRRALVRLTSGRLVTAHGDLLPPQIPLHLVIAEGSTVEGEFDPARNELTLIPRLFDAREAFADGDVTWALVTKVTQARASLNLHPGSATVLRRRHLTTDETTPINEILAVGDVVRARVIVDDSGKRGLTMVDIPGDAPLVPSVPLAVGAPPWLQEGRTTGYLPDDSPTAAPSAPPAPAPPAIPGPGGVVFTDPDPAPEPDTAPEPRPAPPATAQVAAADVKDVLARLDALHNITSRTFTMVSQQHTTDLLPLRAKISLLEAELKAERRRILDLRHEVEAITAERAEAQRALRSKEPILLDRRSRTERREAWADPVEWVRHEIYLAWVDRIHPGERDRWPIRDYSVGSQFAASLDPLDDAQFAKAMRAAVDVVVGRVETIPSRQLHRLRSGDGADDPHHVRPTDGAKCWRVSIEQDTPSARRLHFWQMRDASVELSRVVLHDDFLP